MEIQNAANDAIKTFGAQLAQWRTVVLGKTVEELAAQIELSAETVLAMEEGDGEVPMSAWARIWAHMGTLGEVEVTAAPAKDIVRAMGEAVFAEEDRAGTGTAALEGRE